MYAVPMKVLSIETSCDESGIAIVEVTRGAPHQITVLSNQLTSQASLHAEYGGVFPTLAKREHTRALVPLLQQALKEAGMLIPTRTRPGQEVIAPLVTLLAREQELFVHLTMFLAEYEKPSIDAIAVTFGPGLEPALWVGINFAKALSIVWNIPIIPVNHMEGHIYAALVQETKPHTFTLQDPHFPAIAFLISGGHTELVLTTALGTYELLGATRDDAVGEAFDKTARLLGLPYPGGPEVSKLAQQAREEKLEQPFSLPRPMITSPDLAFSFSGLKTAVLRLTQELGSLSLIQKKQIAREIEDAIAEVLTTKARKALEQTGARTLIVSGGVSANTTIITSLTAMLHTHIPDVTILVSPRALATDNGLMIAFASSTKALSGTFSNPDTIQADGNASLATH